MRNPAEIIDALAARRGLVCPVPAYFPLSREFCEQAIREAVAEAAQDGERRQIIETRSVSQSKGDPT